MLVRVALACLLVQTRSQWMHAVGEVQFAVNCRSGVDQVQMLVQMALEAFQGAAAFSADVVNAFGMMDRRAIRATLCADPALHPFLAVFDMLYTNQHGEL